MDLEEWELLSDDGFLDFHDEDGGKKIFPKSHKSDSKSVFNMDYFICPSSPPSKKFIKPPEKPKVPKNQLVPVPIQFNTSTEQAGDVVKEITKVPIEISVVPPPPLPPLPLAVITQKIKAPPSLGRALDGGDQDPVSLVFFKKMKENEFVDMKMDSPKSSSTRGGIMPPIDSAPFQFDDKDEAYKGEVMDIKPCTSPRMIKIEKDSDTTKEGVTWEENHGGLNIWKWSLTGIGALCSVGVAAATICIIILGSHQKNKQPQQNQKLRFQIYADDKRIKHVVHHATKLNEAISAVRGVPMARAQFTFGGYYEGL